MQFWRKNLRPGWHFEHNQAKTVYQCGVGHLPRDYFAFNHPDFKKQPYLRILVSAGLERELANKA